MSGWKRSREWKKELWAPGKTGFSSYVTVTARLFSLHMVTILIIDFCPPATDENIFARRPT
jgi:hypothetical protein